MILIISLLFLLLFLNYIFMWKYLLLFIFSMFYFFLLTISLKGNEKIISNFCERKNINNSTILKKNKCYLYSFLIFVLILVYIFSIKLRLFIIINNIHIYFLDEVTIRKPLLLNLIIIIIILFTSTILIWIYIFNEKYKNGKYNLFSVFIGLSLIISLFFSIIMFTTGWNIYYIFVLEIISQITILLEIISIFINSDLYLLDSLEKQNFPAININKVLIKWHNIKNYINIKFIKNIIVNYDNIYYKNKYYPKNNTNNIFYNNLFIKRRNSNIILRSIQFIIDILLAFKLKVYDSFFFYSIKLRYINNLNWRYIFSVQPPLIIINDNDTGNTTIKNINMTNLKLDITNKSENNVINNTNLYQNQVNTYNVTQIFPMNLYNTNKEPDGNGDSSNIVPLIENNKNSERSANNNLIDNENIKKRKNVFEQNEKNKKRNIIHSLTTKMTSSLYSANARYHADNGLLDTKKICQDVMREHAYLVNEKKINDIYVKVDEKNITTFPDFLSLSLAKQMSISNLNIILMIANYLNNNNFNIQSCIMTIGFIDYIQIQEFTQITGKLVEKSSSVELDIYTEKFKDAIPSSYINWNIPKFSDKEKIFIKSEIKIPKDILYNMYKLLSDLSKYSFIMNTDLMCKSLISQISEEREHSRKELEDKDKEIINNIKIIRGYIIEKINQAERKKIITKELKILHEKYYTTLIDIFLNSYQKRLNLFWDTLIDHKIKKPNYHYLEFNLRKWGNINTKVLKPIEGYIAEQKAIDLRKISTVGLDISNKNISNMATTNFSRTR